MRLAIRKLGSDRQHGRKGITCNKNGPRRDTRGNCGMSMRPGVPLTILTICSDHTPIPSLRFEELQFVRHLAGEMQIFRPGGIHVYLPLGPTFASSLATAAGFSVPNHRLAFLTVAWRSSLLRSARRKFAITPAKPDVLVAARAGRNGTVQISSNSPSRHPGPTVLSPKSCY